jgi:putative two-component system response regulator
VAVALVRAMNVGEAMAADIEHAAILRNITRLDVHAIGRQVPFLAAASTITAAVQEHFDGTGFPLGLSGERIPLGSRILAVAEAWDELVSGSQHGKSTPAQAIEVLCGERARQFDPAVLEVLPDIQTEN